METRISCQEVEAWATEYAEGVLGKTETHLVDEHLAECANCRAAMQDMRQALALCRKVEGTLVPSGLIQRIIEETTGKLPWRQRLRMFFRPVLEPRVALSLAAALISLSMILHATGADTRNLRLADLAPSQLYKKASTRVVSIGSKIQKYYYDLRVVYEIQTQLQAIREARSPQDSKQNKPPRKQPQTGPAKQLNKSSRQSVYSVGLVRGRQLLWASGSRAEGAKDRPGWKGPGMS